MRIDAVRIEGFGQFGHTELALAPGLNVLSGPNEAGKSTLLAFLRAVLFGFEKKEADRYERESGPYGGELLLDTAAGPLRLRRTGGRRKDGELTLRGAKGEILPASRLEDALGAVGRGLYFEVFAFGLGELASFEKLAKEGSVSDALFAAGMQGASRLPAALESLRKSSEALYTPRGSTKGLNQRMAALAGVQEELRLLGDRPARYAELLARRGELDGVLARLEEECGELREAHGRLCRLAGAAEELIALKEVRAGLASLPGGLRDFPEDGLVRLEARLEAAARSDEEKVAARAEVARLDQALQRLGAPLEVEALEARAQAALEAFRGHLDAARRLPPARAGADERLARARRTLESLGAKGEAPDVGAAARAELASLRERLQRAELLLSERAAAAREAGVDQARRAEELERIDSELAGLGHSGAAELRKKLSSLGQIGPLRAELRAVREAREDRAAQRSAVAAAVDPQPEDAFPAWLLGVALAALGAALGGAAWALGPKAWPWAGAAAAALGAALGFAFWRARRTFRAASSARSARAKVREDELARLARSIEELGREEAERRAALAAALEGCGAKEDAPAALASLEQELSEELRQAESRERLARLRPDLEAKAQKAAQRFGTAKEAEEIARRARAEAAEALSVWLAKRGLPEGLSADRAFELCAELAKALEQEAAARGELSALAREEEQVRSSRDELLACAEAAGLAGTEPGALAAALAQALESARERRRELARVEADRAAAQVRLEGRAEARERAAAALAELLAAAGCEGEDAFRAKALQAQRWRALEAEGARLRAGIEGKAGQPPEEAEEALARAGGAEAARSEAERLRAELSSREAGRVSASDERGAVRGEIERLERDGEIAALRAREEALKLEVEALATAYARDRLALSMLVRARARHEEEHQPRLLQLASAQFSKLTSGRYVRVRANQEDRTLLALGADGKEWPAERLSRGTREQLYLAFRLAVIEDFGASRARLPVVVDDVLVNFDPARAAAACAVLADLAGRQQVLAFTCHPHMAELLAARGAHAVELA